LATRGAAGAPVVPPAEQALGLVHGDGDDDGGVDDEVGAAARAPQQRARAFLDGGEHHRADRRPEEGAHAAEDRHQRHLDREPGVQHRARVDVELLLRVEAAAQRGERGRDGQRQQLVAREAHAQAARRVGLVLDGAEVVAEAAAFDAPGDEQAEHQQRECQVVVGRLAGEDQGRPALPVHGDGQADGGAGELPVGEERLDDLGHRDGRHREVVALQAEAGPADQQAQARRDPRADAGAEPRVDAEVQQQRGRGVGAQAEERGVAERHLAGVAAEDVPGDAQLRGHQHQDHEVHVRRAVDGERQHGQGDGAQAQRGQRAA
jgi:hypothetical protein